MLPRSNLFIALLDAANLIRKNYTMDRRQFLGLFSSAALASIAPIDRLVAVNRNRFESQAFRLSFDIPDRWIYWTAEEIIRNRDALVYVEDARSVYEFSSTPFVAFSRYREPHPDLNPGFCVYGDRVAPWMGKDILTFGRETIEYFSTVVKNSVLSRPTQRVVFGGYEAARGSVIYDLVCNNGFQHRVVDELVVMFHMDYLLMFQFEQSLNGPERAANEFRKVEASLSFG